MKMGERTIQELGKSGAYVNVCPDPAVRVQCCFHGVELRFRVLRVSLPLTKMAVSRGASCWFARFLARALVVR